MKKYKFRVFASMACVCFALTSCINNEAGPSEAESQAGGASIPVVDRDKFSSVKPIYDSENMLVETPLDRYVNSVEEQVQIVTANYFPIRECVERKGYPVAYQFYSSDFRPEAPLGVWSQQYAEKYGYSVERRGGKVYLDAGVKDVSEEAQEVMIDCEKSLVPYEIPVYLHGDTGLAETAVIGEVYNYSQILLDEDEDVKTAIDEWVQCLEGKGIAIDRSYTLPGPVVPEDSEDQIKQALEDVACKEEVRLTQRYFEAQAQYEQALIEENQAAFNVLAEKKEENLAKARAILIENGIQP